MFLDYRELRRNVTPLSELSLTTSLEHFTSAFTCHKYFIVERQEDQDTRFKSKDVLEESCQYVYREIRIRCAVVYIISIHQHGQILFHGRNKSLGVQ